MAYLARLGRSMVSWGTAGRRKSVQNARQPPEQAGASTVLPASKGKGLGQSLKCGKMEANELRTDHYMNKSVKVSESECLKCELT